MLRTTRLNLQPWHEQFREAFAALHADPAVMGDQGGPISRRSADAKFDRYRAAVQDRQGCFIGYVGVMPRPEPDHPLGPHHEVGWRLVRSVWGQGYAAEGARAALGHAFQVLGGGEILSYTSDLNRRSQAVMERLGLERTPSRDFTAKYDGIGQWQGLVWVATATAAKVS